MDKDRLENERDKELCETKYTWRTEERKWRVQEERRNFLLGKHLGRCYFVEKNQPSGVLLLLFYVVVNIVGCVIGGDVVDVVAAIKVIEK